MARMVEFEDGFTSLVEPTEGFVSASSLLIFESDAAYVAAKGEAAAEGDIYYNSTLKQVRTFNGTNWRGSGVVTVISAGQWVASESLGAMYALENGVEVYKFEQGANQKIHKVVTVPENYPGGPIFINIPLYSPGESDAARFKLTATLANPADPISTVANKNEIEFAVEFSAPGDRLENVKVFLTANGEINDVQVDPKAKLKLEVERIVTEPSEEGADTTEDIRILKSCEEFVFE